MRSRSALAVAILFTSAVALLACSDSDLPQSDTSSNADLAQNDIAAEADLAEGDVLVIDEDCTGKADGVACGSADLDGICLAENCVTSSCGDGYIDTDVGEQCEDGNEVEGDGCTGCKWDCSADADCDDDNVCTGSESCDADEHTCVAGTAPTEETVCTRTGESDGICNGGVCVDAGCGNGLKANDEDCDDGNEIAGDGCEADCTWTCEIDADCDDQNACTGTETCDKTDADAPVCKAGTAVVCTSDNCEGTCEPSTGACAYADADRDGASCDTDCNDADPAVYPGATECADGKDNDCDPDTPDAAGGECKCYADGDGDGFASASPTTITTGNCPDNYTSVKPADRGTTDCREKNPDFYPDNPRWYHDGYCTKYIGRLCASLSKEWDYNCSGAVEMQYPKRHDCRLSTTGLKYSCTGSGWTEATVPACGAKASFTPCQLSGLFRACVPGPSSTREQLCH